MEEALIQAIINGGGVTLLAQKLLERNPGNPITKSAISQWRLCPPGRVLDVEAITGISRYELRPDIYGPAPTTAEQGVEARP